MPICEPEHHPQSDDQDQPTRHRCRHIFTAGRRCGSPCLRNEHFCYYHHTTRKPVPNPREHKKRAAVYDLPNPEDRDAIRAAVAQLMHAIARNEIDLKRAGMLLYSLQISLCSLPPQPRPAPLTAANSNPAKDMVEDTVLDDTHGVIAPEAEYEEPEELKPRKSLGQQLLDEVEAFEAKQAAEVEQARQAELIAAANPAPATSSPPNSYRPAAIDLRAATEPAPQTGCGCGCPTHGSHLAMGGSTSTPLRASADENPNTNPLRPSRLRARLQPCRNHRLHPAALAAEVRLQPNQSPLTTKARIHPDPSQTCPRHCNPTKAATHNPHHSVKPLIYLAATAGGKPSAPASSTAHTSCSLRADWHLNDHHPRDHRISRGHQEALAHAT